VAERLSAALGQGGRAFPSEEISWAARTALEGLARTRPLVVVLEDLHWAEPTFLDLVDHVADLASNAPILLLCLARPELLDDRPTWGGGKRNATTIELEPLDDDEASLLVGELLGSAQPRAAEERIVAAAEGNPLFLEQIAAMLDETAPGDGEVALPPSIHALLAGRLERLGPGERGVLERAAIVGKEFSDQETAVLLPDEARPTVIRHLETLIRKRFIRPAPSASGRAGPYQFRHGLIQEAAYRGLSKRLRADLHQRFAEWMEEDSPHGASEVAEILGYHLERAYWLRTELGPADDQVRSLAARAATRLAAAGRRALDRGDADASSRLLERAAAVLPPVSAERLELLHRLGEALRKAGHFRRAAGVLDEAIELAGTAGEQRALSYALIERARVRIALEPEGADQEARECAAAAIRVFDELGDERGLSRAWQLWSQLDLHLCRWEPYREANERAVLHARRAAAEIEAMDALDAIAHALSHDATPASEAIVRCQEIRRDSSANRQKEARVLTQLGFLFALQGRRHEAEESFARGRAILDDLGLPIASASLALHAGQGYVLLGDPAAAEHELRRGQRLYEQAGERSSFSTLTAILAKAVYGQGGFEEAEQLAERALELGSSDDLGTVVEAFAVRAKVCARRGDADRGDVLLSDALRLVDQTDMLWLRGVTRMDRAEFSRLAGRPAAAAQAAREAMAFFEQKGADGLSARAGRFLSEFEATD
jgi:tetratricopeptide (TPR) repeat protein